MFFWLIASVYAATGSLRLAFLLPSALAGLGTLALVWDLARRLWGRRAALLAGLALLATLQFTLQARTAQIDAVVALWITLGVYGLARHLLLGPAWRWWYVAFAAMGLGVITKGVGFLPVLLLVPWGIARWRRLANLPRFAFPWWHAAGGPLVMLAVIAAWLVPVLLAVAASGDPALAAYRDDILLRQTATRYAAAWHHRNWVGYYLVEVIPWAWLPLTAALPWLLPAWWRRLRRGDARAVVLLGWAALVLLFFSASPGKRGVYVLPVVPAFVLAAAPLLPGLLRRARIGSLARWGAAAWSAVVLAVAAAVPVLARVNPRRLEDLGVDPTLLVPPLAALGVAGLAVTLAAVAPAWGRGARRRHRPLVAGHRLLGQPAAQRRALPGAVHGRGRAADRARRRARHAGLARAVRPRRGPAARHLRLRPPRPGGGSPGGRRLAPRRADPLAAGSRGRTPRLLRRGQGRHSSASATVASGISPAPTTSQTPAGGGRRPSTRVTAASRLTIRTDRSIPGRRPAAVAARQMPAMDIALEYARADSYPAGSRRHARCHPLRGAALETTLVGSEA